MGLSSKLVIFKLFLGFGTTVHDHLGERVRNYYDFVRPHMALNGKTPAEKAGIDLGLGERKWEELIRQSVNGRKGNKKHTKKVSENRSLDSYF